MSAPISYKHIGESEPVDHLLRWGELRGLNEGKIKYLADLMEQGIALPAIKIVWGLSGLWSVQDGWHRCAASLSLGHSHIWAITNMSPWPRRA
jgi:hypothetical protein